MSYPEFMAPKRRVTILRVLVGLSGDANESLLCDIVRALVASAVTRDDIRADIDHLIAVGCVRDSWEDGVRKAVITDRGEDAAFGRIQVDGVSRSRWEGPKP